MKQVCALMAMTIGLVGCQQEPEVLSGAPKDKNEIKRNAKNPTVAPAAEVSHPDRVYQIEDLEVVEVEAPKATLKTWVMDTPGKRTEGMMFLKPEEVEDEQAMIFVFDKDQEIANSFWMKDTPTALDIVFVDSLGKVINVAPGEANSEDQVRPKGAYRYVLEVKQGLAKKFGITPGASLKIPNTVDAKG